MAATEKFSWNNDYDAQSINPEVTDWFYSVNVPRLKDDHELGFLFSAIVQKDDDIDDLDDLGLELRASINMRAGYPYPCNARLEGQHDNFYLTMHLHVNPKTFRELFRLFSTTLCNGLLLDFSCELEHPSGNELGFWRTKWQKRWVEISDFRFASTMHRRYNRVAFDERDQSQ